MEVKEVSWSEIKAEVKHPGGYEEDSSDVDKNITVSIVAIYTKI